MERFMILCCLVLSIATVSSGTLCLSNTNCPHDQPWCVKNCSAVGIEEFNLTASHGNCKISSTNGGITYDCHIGSCSTELCVASGAPDTNDTTCCCTGDFCNANFSVSLTTTPPHYHIYPSFPSHVTSDQLVCEFYNCTDEADCVRGYEVCDENRLMGFDDHSFVCVAVLYQNTDKMEVLYKGCFIDQDSSYSDTCVLQEYPENYYSCECNGNLCNNNGSTIIPSNHTSTIPSTDATEPVPVTTGGVKGNHIYPTYPQHTRPDQLVCEYYNCTDEAHCVQGYEVCDENPEWVGDVCVAAFHRNNSKLEVLKGCFLSNGGTYDDSCVLTEYPLNTYSCLCNTTLCNSKIVPSDLPTISHSTPVISSVKITTTTTTTTTSNDAKPNYVPLIYGVTAGVCVLIILTVVVIVMLAYCRVRSVRHTQSVSYNKLINS